MRSTPRSAAALLYVVAVAAVAIGAPTKADLQKQLRDEEIVGDWNYDDIGGGFARANKEKKPVCIVFR